MFLIRELKSAELSVREIAAMLDRREIVSKRGCGQWSHTVVAKILGRAGIEEVSRGIEAR